MQIQIHVRDKNLPSSVRDFAERSVTAAIARHATSLTRVVLHLEDLNGQKGGQDKRCVVEAHPRGLDPVVVRHEAVDVREAVTVVSEKLENALRNRFERRGWHTPPG